MRRVVITGAGTVNPLGHSVPETYAGLRAGRSAIGPFSIPDLDRLSVRIGAQVRDFDPGARLTPRQMSLCDRFAQFALVAAEEAVAQAGVGALTPGAGVILGTAGGGLMSSEAAYRAVFADGAQRAHPFTVPRLMANAATSHLTMAYGLRGPSFTVSTACAASNHAIGLAFQMVRSGAAPVMLAGGSEAMLSFGGIKAWEGLRVLSQTGCRPFCASRDGLVMGEGAAVFVLEDRARAIARGAPILAEVAGFGMSADAGDIVVPDPAGAEAAMRAALDDAGLLPEAIGYINAHGTGTAVNDRSECAAIRRVFGEAAGSVPISSTKSLHGHLIGAAGAVELLAVLLALGEGVIAPTAGHRADDPDCALDVVTHEARHWPVAAALSNAFAFGGLNAVLALRAAE
ncbi:beta-ketoacyl-[acyl-carrier-protein] synthase family protein [Albidovulum sediminicola]|uniref:Nodulation protein E n=1 Tax=Albidovulum sediminicola TaxID=2984331 RepID=A0ABT2Z3R2_9RHOB|nr:beta-ketoacyl-[acyl-carrier-protein] synthase family protein [Defluviimonas sp. WL0075]MCV2865779.1 beta-ketoacyl-[acyl-carrier-protein] synthase family protein [Defluviimonas sp. WL0075]